jgi:hypothetical protein
VQYSGMAMTIVQIRRETKEKPDGLKIHPRETYDNLINRLADAAFNGEELIEEEIALLRESDRDIRAGILIDEETIRKKYGA